MNDHEMPNTEQSGSKADDSAAPVAAASHVDAGAGGSDLMIRPGRHLAELRQRQGRSLAELSAALKLPRSVLEAIEEDRLDRIAPIYRRGYLVNYARELGEPPDLYLGVEVDAPPPLTGVLPAAPLPRTDRWLRSATYFLGTTLIVAPLVYFFIVGGARLFDGVEEQRPTVAGSPSGENSEVSRRISRALALDQGAAERLEEQRPLAASTLPLPTLRPAVSTPVDQVLPSVAESAEDTPSEHALELELLQDSWVEIFDANGERLEFDLLRADTRSGYEGTPPFRILLGRANAVRITLDGQPVEHEGSASGGVAQFSLSPPSDESDRALDASRASDSP
jgi:cytoskeleton protein RodZ